MQAGDAGSVRADYVAGLLIYLQTSHGNAAADGDRVSCRDVDDVVGAGSQVPQVWFGLAEVVYAALHAGVVFRSGAFQRLGWEVVVRRDVAERPALLSIWQQPS